MKMRKTLLFVALLSLQREITVEAQSQAAQQIETGQQMDRAFLTRGIDRVGGKSTNEQHAAFVATKPEALRLGREFKERLLNFMKENNRQGQDRVVTGQSVVSEKSVVRVASFGVTSSATKVTPKITSKVTPKIPPKDQCPPVEECKDSSAFRTADGSCNNLRNPSWGKSFIPMRRSLPPQYDDGLFSPRVNGRNGMSLPSPRLISTTLHTADPGPRTWSTVISHMTMQWAQFLDHDITLTPIERGADGAAITCCEEDVPAEARVSELNVTTRPQCFPISIPERDRRFNRSCMNFVRSVLVANADCNTVPAEQLNQLTAYIDASQVYGSTEEEQASLRTFRGGLLKTSRKKTLLPKNPVPECVTSTFPNFCFKAGDERVDEHMALASLHTIWLREHNRIASTLSKINNHWDDERLFQETRKIVGAMLQHITYNEFLPLVLSSTDRKKYKLNLEKGYWYSRVYDRKVDASIRNSFATAAFRFGHSMIRTIFSQRNRGFQDIGKIQLRNSFGNTSIILSSNGKAVNTLTRGLLTDPARKVDRHVTPEVSDFLFVDRDGNSLDLMALNIQRGRDHGLPGYNAWRKWCGLPRAGDFGTRRGGLVDHRPDAANTLKKLYKSPDDIDLFSGGVSEKPVRGGLIGRTFSCIVARQFKALRVGDRFWYETGDRTVRFTSGQLRELRRASLARVICDNTDTSSIQPYPLRIAQKRNRIRKCSSSRIRKMNLNHWRERTYYG